MRRDVDSVNFGGRPLNSLRNLTPEYFSEDDNSRRPVSVLSQEVLGVDYHGGSFDLELPSPPETTELGNETLPVFAYRHELVDAVKKHPFTIVVAETGAGKSTQVPQFLLDAGWDTVYLTQPRRAAARNVFERIRDEVGSVRGTYEASNLVSYQTAVERDGPENARIKVVTDGLQLVRELHDSGIVENDVLIIDEVHEWNTNIEVLVAWAKKIIAEKPQLRVVVMSATMDADRLANYFSGVCDKTPPIIEIPGRNYNVDISEKPRSTVVEEVLRVTKILQAEQSSGDKSPNGILVFEPGKREIQDAIDEIQRRLSPELASVTTILPLHSKQTVAEQQLAFGEYPGVKIVVATDVAQTSLTIPDIKYVIDSGYQRRVELDQEDVQGLVLHSISQADCDQRAGRTGRLSDGFYILTRLNDSVEHIPYIARDKFPTAEILRTDIVRNTLLVAGVDLNIALLDLYHPVDLQIIERSQSKLRTLEALDGDNSITSLGKRMNQFPLSVSSARMMVEVGRYPEQTRSYMAAIVAAKEVGGLQYFAYNVDKRWKELTEEKTSDLLAQLDIYIATQEMTDEEMKNYDLDLHNVGRAREQYRKIAKRVDAVQEYLMTPTAEEREDLKRCIYVGLVTSMYKSSGEGTYTRLDNNDTVRQISNRSVVSGAPKFLVGDAYRVEHYTDGERVQKHIIEHITTATLAELGRAAIHLCDWQSEGYIMRAGRFVNIRRLSLFGNDLGIVNEVTAEPSAVLREKIIAHVLENAGPQQNKLRAIKKELEQLAHLAKDPVKQLTHDAIVSLIHEATPDDITDPSIIDNNLRVIMQERDINLDAYADSERRSLIVANAPEEIQIQDVTLRVSYKSRKPLVKHYDSQEIAKLNEEIFLSDGRQVYFVHGSKHCSLVELKEKLNINSYV